MDFFPLTIKLYHMWEDNVVRLGVKSSLSTVLTFYFQASEFQKMIEEYNEKVERQDGDYFSCEIP